MTNFTIGSDSEFFMKRNDGKFVSAIPFLNGTKHHPEFLPEGGNIQRDNVSLEIATNPANSLEAFLKNVQLTMKGAFGKLPEGHDLIATPSACFDQDQLEDPEAQMFGCDADYDAYEVRENDKPFVKNPLFRSCGAHIHVGTGDNEANNFLLDFWGKINMVKTMDALHGLISTILDHSKEAVDRRQLYGKAGTHRPKPYGVEYRVLSNFWKKSPVLVKLMYHLTEDAIELMRSEKALTLIEEIGEDNIKRIINEGLAEEAEKAVKDHVWEHLSDDSRKYYNLSIETLSGIKALSVEWGIKEAV